MDKCKFEIVFVVSQMYGWIDSWMDSDKFEIQVLW